MRSQPKVYQYHSMSLILGSAINVLPDGFHVSRRCDWIMYAVEAEHVDSVIAKYGPGMLIIDHEM